MYAKKKKIRKYRIHFFFFCQKREIGKMRVHHIGNVNKVIAVLGEHGVSKLN